MKVFNAGDKVTIKSYSPNPPYIGTVIETGADMHKVWLDTALSSVTGAKYHEVWCRIEDMEHFGTGSRMVDRVADMQTVTAASAGRAISLAKTKTSRDNLSYQMGEFTDAGRRLEHSMTVGWVARAVLLAIFAYLALAGAHGLHQLVKASNDVHTAIITGGKK
jgi:hypothetical protein